MAKVNNISKKDRAKYAFDFFVKKGWTKEQAAGLVGNFVVESMNFSDKVISTFETRGDSGSAYGVAQWRNERVRKFKDLYGKPLTQATFEEQLEYVHWELNNSHKSAGNKLKKAKTAEQAAEIVDKKYEISSGEHRGKRMNIAKKLASGDFKNYQNVTNKIPNTSTTSINEKKTTWNDLKKKDEFSKYVPDYLKGQEKEPWFRNDLLAFYQKQRNNIKNSELNEDEKIKEFDKLNMAMYHEGYLDMINHRQSKIIENRNKKNSEEYQKNIKELEAVSSIFNQNKAGETGWIGEDFNAPRFVFKELDESPENVKKLDLVMGAGKFQDKMYLHEIRIPRGDRRLNLVERMTGINTEYHDVLKKWIEENPELGKIEGRDFVLDFEKFVPFFEEKFNKYSEKKIDIKRNLKRNLSLKVFEDDVFSDKRSINSVLRKSFDFVPTKFEEEEYNQIQKNEAWDNLNIYADEDLSNDQDPNETTEDAGNSSDITESNSEGSDYLPVEEVNQEPVEDDPNEIKDLASEFLGQTQKMDDFIYDPKNYKKELPIDSLLTNSVNAIIGSKLANTELPLRDEVVSDALIRHANELKMISEQGLSPEEEVARKKMLNESYQSSLDAYARQSNGNRNVVLANIGRLDQSKMDQLTQMALKDEELRMDAFMKHGEALKGIDNVRLEKEIANHSILLGEAERKIEAGAELMGSAIGSMVNDIKHYKETKPGSWKHALESYTFKKIFDIDPTLKNQDDPDLVGTIANKKKRIAENRQKIAQNRRATNILNGFDDTKTKVLGSLLEMNITSDQLAQSIERLDQIDATNMTFNGPESLAEAVRTNDFSGVFSNNNSNTAENTTENTINAINNIRTGNDHLIDLGNNNKNDVQGLQGNIIDTDNLFTSTGSEGLKLLQDQLKQSTASVISTTEENQNYGFQLATNNGTDLFNFQDKSEVNPFDLKLKSNLNEDKSKLDLKVDSDPHNVNNLLARVNEMNDQNELVEQVVNENQQLISEPIVDVELSEELKNTLKS